VVIVAVLASKSAVASEVDPVTVVFTGAYPVRWTLEDVDRDGEVDLLFHCKTQDLDFTERSTWAALSGETL